MSHILYGYPMGGYHGYPYAYAGCYFYLSQSKRSYLPLVKSSVHTTIFSDRQQTTIQQKYTNSTKKDIKTCKYSFPIYDGVSVTGFECEIEGRKLTGIVKEKEEAKADFDHAVQHGYHAGLLEQSDTSDVFSTSLGNVEAGQDVLVTITYIGELKSNLDLDSIRLTIPTHIAPRYGQLPEDLRDSHLIVDQGMDLRVDVVMPKDRHIQGLESPSHPVSVSLGRLSTDSADQEPSFSRATATLSATSSGLDKDFVFLVNAKETGNPEAILQTHSTLENHRALMLSLVPKFSLPSIKPEIVFVADRSGSMQGSIHLLQQALTVFLKSMTSGVKFNICSFGTYHKFLWSKSQDYTKKTLNQALKDVESFGADFGGTETLKALEATIKNRYKDIPLEIILLTDGDIWDQDTAFKTVGQEVVKSKQQIRLFPLGIGSGVSHSLIEGLARAGNGFAQAVQDGERMDNRVVRMLKAALTPHITNYSLEIKYDSEDDFELIEAVESGLTLSRESTIQGTDDTQSKDGGKQKKKMSGIIKSAISLFNPSSDPDTVDTSAETSPLPGLTVPKLLQAPHNIPALYSFSRTTVYVLMSPETIQRNPVSVILKADSEHGPLRLEIPVTILDTPGDAICQLAARKAVQDLEEHRGWVYDVTDSKGTKLMEKYPSRATELVKKEAVRLGTTYGIANKWCSFIAVDSDRNEIPTEDDNETLMEQDESIETESMSYQAFSLGTRGGFGGGAPKKRKSAAPRRQLASKAARKAVPAAKYAAMPPPPPAMAAPGGPMMMMQQSAAIPHSAPIQQSVVASQFQSASSYAGGLAASAAPQPSFSPARARLSNVTNKERSLFGTGHAASMDRAEMHSIAMDDASSEDQDEEEGGSSEALGHLAYSSTVASKPAPPRSDYETVHGLIGQQDFDGFWAYTPVTKQLLGRFFTAENKSESELKSQDGTVWITALVIAFLRTSLSAEKDVWELVVDKALTWLEEQNGGKETLARAEKHVLGVSK